MPDIISTYLIVVTVLKSINKLKIKQTANTNSDTFALKNQGKNSLFPI